MEWIKLTDISKPKQWKTVPMKNLLKEGYPVYGANGIIGYYDKYTHDEPVLLIGCRGSIGSVYKTEDKVYANGNAMALDSLDEDIVNIDYLYYYLKSYNFDKITTGTSQPQLTQTSLRRLKIPVPPTEVQKQIVEVLQEAEELINNREQQIELLDDLIDSLFYTMFGDPVNNKMDWDIRMMKELGKVGSSRRVYLSETVDEGIPFYRGQEISRLSYGDDPNNKLYITREHYKKLKKQRGIPKKGDLLLPSICPDGDVWMVNTDEPFYFKDGRVLWVELEEESINNFFIKTALSYVLKNSFRSISSGSTFAELKIFLLEQIKIPVPPLSLQNEFAEKVKVIEEHKEMLNKSLELLKENYNSIMDRAFKGELFR